VPAGRAGPRRVRGVEARARKGIGGTREDAMLFRGMDRAALDAAYNNTAAVGIPKRDQYVAGWSARSEALRKTRAAKIDLRYGHEARQRLDVFSGGETNAPNLAYIHGGYWQMNDKEPYGFIGEGPLAPGVSLAPSEYTP